MPAIIETGMNLYEANKQLLANEPVLDPIQRNQKIKELADNLNLADHFYMMLCRERSDYTIFNFNSSRNIERFKSDLAECLGNRGETLAIDKKGDEVWEIWIRDPATKEVFMYLFFNYDQGVLAYE